MALTESQTHKQLPMAKLTQGTRRLFSGEGQAMDVWAVRFVVALATLESAQPR